MTAKTATDLTDLIMGMVEQIKPTAIREVRDDLGTEIERVAVKDSDDQIIELAAMYGIDLPDADEEGVHPMLRLGMQLAAKCLQDPAFDF